MKPSILAASGAILGAIALSGCVPVVPAPAPPSVVLTPVVAVAPPVMVVPPPPIAYVRPHAHHYVAVHRVPRRRVLHHYAVTRVYRRVGIAGCGAPEHPCDVEHKVVPIK
jgi:hypothetical protein